MCLLKFICSANHRINYLHMHVIIINPQIIWKINKNWFLYIKDILIINEWVHIKFSIPSFLFSIKQRKCIIILYFLTFLSVLPNTRDGNIISFLSFLYFLFFVPNFVSSIILTKQKMPFAGFDWWRQWHQHGYLNLGNVTIAKQPPCVEEGPRWAWCRSGQGKNCKWVRH